MRSRAGFLAVLLLLAGCGARADHRLDSLYGAPDPARYDRPSSGSAARASWERAKAVFDGRCVVCHACYDAPCQLKLSSRDGVVRGGSKEKVYGLRLIAMRPTRLHVDADTAAEWRQRGFHAVLNERRSSPAADREGSVMARLLDLKRRHAPETGILPADKYDFSLDRAQQCATVDEMDELERTKPELGMPFGMPQLGEAEYRTLVDWILSDAAYAPPAPLAAPYRQRVDAWEAFLNGDSIKQQLMARYVYEHWYLGHFWFDDLPAGEWFELVRSSTPPGQPIAIIATVRPFDDPGVPRVYYRLRRMDETIVAKTHMPYALDAARMQRLKSLFLDPDYTVTALPSWAPDVASNPFVAFHELPVAARYRLMLDEAQYTIMNFIKGPVCRGQVALNVINDLFWVSFVDPDLEQLELSSEALKDEMHDLHLPAEDENDLPLLKWRKYTGSETRYLAAKSAYLNEHFAGKGAPTLGMLWDGDGRNTNAALTVFRHFDSATVVRGFVGTRPQTAWVVGYPLLERIHYLLVAGYDVYGNLSHQVTTRMYMDFLRMEGESNFLALLPLASRDAVRDHWYRGVGDDVKQYLQGSKSYFAQETGVRYRTNEPMAELDELYGMLGTHFGKLLDRRYEIRTKGLPRAVQAQLARLDALSGRSTSILPEVTFLTLDLPGGAKRQYTLLHNAAHLNISTLFDEAKNRLPAEDDVTLVEGFLGAYPNAFMELTPEELPRFVDGVASLTDEAGYAQLMTDYGIRRSDARFWPHSDEMHAAYRRSAPIEAGVLDYNRYENR